MAKSFSTLAVLVLLFSQPLNATGQEVSGMVRDVVLTGEQYKILEVAVAEFKKTNLDILEYKVTLYRKESSFLALFEDQNVSESQRGSPPNTLSFEVEISSGFQVLRTNFSR